MKDKPVPPKDRHLREGEIPTYPQKVTIEDLILECLKNNIPIAGCELKEDKIAYQIHIGSKTGVGFLYVKYNKIIFETRYDCEVVIENFADISNEAFRWYFLYKDTNPFKKPDSFWLPIWVKEGRIEVIAKEVKEYKIKYL